MSEITESKVLESETPINEQQMNELAKGGWRLVTTVYWVVDGRGKFYWYFYRQPTLQ